MKITIEIADDVFRRMKARAALAGQSLRAFLHAAIQEKLKDPRKAGRRTVGWKAVFGKGRRRSLGEVQARIDQEFSKIRIEDWA